MPDPPPFFHGSGSTTLANIAVDDGFQDGCNQPFLYTETREFTRVGVWYTLSDTTLVHHLVYFLPCDDDYTAIIRGGGVLVQLCSSRIYSRVISSWLSGLSAWQRWRWGAWVGNWNCVISCFISACLALEEIHPFSYKKSAHNPAGLGFLIVKTGFSGVICSLHPALESRRSSTASERKGARGLRASLTRGKSLTRSRSKSPFRSFRFRKSKPDADTTYSDEEGGETFRLIGRSAGGGAGRWQEKPFPPFSKCHNLATFFLT